MMRLLVAAGLVMLLGCCPAGAAGFQWATAPDADDVPLQVAIGTQAATKPRITKLARST